MPPICSRKQVIGNPQVAVYRKLAGGRRNAKRRGQGAAHAAAARAFSLGRVADFVGFMSEDLACVERPNGCRLVS
jgi:hypothetical protein